MNDAMSGLFVGPMPLDQFLNEFLPQPVAVPVPGDVSATLFDDMPRAKLERQMYKPFIDLIRNNGLIPGYQIVNTSDYPDHDSDVKIRPDPTMYKSTVDVSKKVMQFGELELHFELKGRSQDRSQLIHYATEWFSRQHRRFAFTVFICDPWVRFIRWDRAGAVVSERFDYRKNSQPLIDFLWRFTHHDDAGRGKDPTVVPATPHQVGLAHLYLSEWKKGPETPVVVFEVPDVDGAPRRFIAWFCMAHSGSLTGRCTRAYPVYEEATGKRYFLKDTWRAHDLAKEASILRELQEAGVQYIPPFVCGGDLLEDSTLTDLYVPEEERAADGVGEREGDDSDDRLEEPSPKRNGAWRCGRSWKRITQRFHHRFIVDFIGKPLTEVTSSKNLMRAISHAFTAHRQAYESKNKIIHRDISANNILVDSEGNGILNDWDLAKRESDLTRARLHERTGTWEFMSCLLLMRKHTIHTVQDDMESFVHIMLYYGLRYFRHSEPSSVRIFIRDIFEYRESKTDGTPVGGTNKRNMFDAESFLRCDLRFDSPPLNEWMPLAFAAVKQWLNFVDPPSQNNREGRLKALLGHAPQPKPALRASPPTEIYLRNHAAMATIFSHCLGLDDWPDNDAPVDAIPMPVGTNVSARSKRTRDTSELDRAEDDSSVGASTKKSRTSQSNGSHSMNTRSRTGHSYSRSNAGG
ncbi:hypothetical protein FPV67DRAFT_1508553, partial [Lyophyllum atratum]